MKVPWQVTPWAERFSSLRRLRGNRTLRWCRIFGQGAKVLPTWRAGTGMKRTRKRYCADFKAKVAL